MPANKVDRDLDGPVSASTKHNGARWSSPSAASASVMSDANIRNFAPVARIMKTALPDNAKIAKEAKECMQECVSEFISFITSEGMVPGLYIILNALQLTLHSIRKMSAREAQNGQRGGHTVRNDLAWIRELRRSSEDLLVQISRSESGVSIPFQLQSPLST
jgi:hypothetical protein